MASNEQQTPAGAAPAPTTTSNTLNLDPSAFVEDLHNAVSGSGRLEGLL